jgi:hypothetical protein
VTRTRFVLLVLPFAVVAVALVAAGLWLRGYLLGDGQSDAAQARAPAERTADPPGPRHRALGSGRVPKLRVARPAAASPAPAVAAPGRTLTPRARLAPLIALYGEFLEETALDVTSQREVRRMLHLAHESVLRGEQLAAQRLGEVGSAPGRRQRALLELEREVREGMPDQAERVLAHPFIQELLAWNEPLFESTPRGVVNLREDLRPQVP